MDTTGGHLFPGDKLKYTVTVLNVGNVPAQNVVVTDVLPTQLTGAVVQSGGTLAGQTATWTLPTLAVGQTASVTVEATVAAGERTGHLPETFAELAKERQAAWQQQLRLAVRVLGAAMTLAAMLYVGWTVVAQMQQSAGNPLAGLPASDVRELERALGKDLFK